ncbi:unnamed protein product [Lepeophtheirus salmonis]|uniref:(salmon louse) hypothetical protein n=1 Tax=Lepeophtheirus salmonis TaxID=72036 RepID=A0A7R8HCB1_LEPSM|nr:unnamed protein product [Lepeophtheirus salmonis]CAF2986435.1 unnamed protein product [Lepeophtheirus salmonis]
MVQWQLTFLFGCVIVVLANPKSTIGRVHIDRNIQLRGEDTNMDINCWIKMKEPNVSYSWILSPPMLDSVSENEAPSSSNNTTVFIITSELIQIHKCLEATSRRIKTSSYSCLLQLNLLITRKESCLNQLINQTLQGSCISIDNDNEHVERSENFILTFLNETPGKIAEMDDEGNLKIFRASSI